MATARVDGRVAANREKGEGRGVAIGSGGKGKAVVGMVRGVVVDREGGRRDDIGLQLIENQVPAASMKLSCSFVFRPLGLFIILALVLLLLPGLLIPFWIRKFHRIETETKLISHKVHQGILSGIDNTAKLLSPTTNLSLTNLARFLNSSLNSTDPPFSAIESQVAPVLFIALSTIPNLSQISYVALDGLFFSFYIRGDQPFSVYSNTTFSSFTRARANNYTWYTQPVNRDTGKRYGEALRTPPLLVFDSSWFQELLKSRNGHSSVGKGWNTDQDPLLIIYSFSIDQRRAISLGFPVKPLTDSFLSGINLYGGTLYLAVNDGMALTQGIQYTRIRTVGNSISIQLLNPNGDQIGNVGDVTCQRNDGTLRASVLEIWKTKYEVFCSSIELVGVQLVYVLALPFDRLESSMHQYYKFAVVLLALIIAALAISNFTFVFLTIRAAKREMYLCAALIKQLEATQQAERKSMNKSLAFARASHDVRASLAAIIGSIHTCSEKVAPRSDLQKTLAEAESHTEDLLGMLNSILDTSKIEAGKTQLEEEEFDLEQLLEDVVDLYHPVGMKKGVDVVLDPCDGSVAKCSHVKGDRGKLKQILWNLLSNAVKFTSEGHVLVRVWAKKPSFENNILATSQKNSMRCMSCLLFQTNATTYKDLEVKNVQQDPNCMEFIFEVSDTGRGIPKEKQKMVFENYVQVKETALGQEGTGLGLGIVQSLVRIMGGEIAIVEKELCEKGTCFRFNTFFSLCGNVTDARADDHDIESHCSQLSGKLHQQPGPSTHTYSPKADGSHVVLFISSDERSKILQKFIESLGIIVSVVKQWEQLPQTLRKIKQKLIFSRLNTSRETDVNSITSRLSRAISSNSSSRSKEGPLSARDGKDAVASSEKKMSSKSTLNFVLIVIDTNAGPFREISRAVAEFRRDLSSSCSRVVWTDRPGSGSISVQGLEEDKLPPMDLIISKPLHGSRLHQVILLLPEFGGTMPVIKVNEGNAYQSENVVAESSSLNSRVHWQFKSRHPSSQTEEIQEIGISNIEKPLHGKKFLIAEDDPTLQRVAERMVSQLGADKVTCRNGEEALEIVCKNLSDGRKTQAHQSLPFDYILMDCEMQAMDGYEATRCIREEEKYYGLHIPIIALTAHTLSEVRNKMIEAGMDYYLSKPLKREQLLDVILRIHGK
ncbi:hypothetical protein ACH5RR_000743 [Cinchona calisaya]|uniref:histidine kinase n=1 Tax=Cinchona calisaya TaxID=153742 RepID=A0ABD3B1F9_9GENT